MKKLVALLLLAPTLALASSAGPNLDRAPVDLHNLPSLQRGAQVFVNYCLNCHSANFMRYNRLRDLGLSEQQIRDNLMFAADKVGETMTVAMRSTDAAHWFGVAPPDLSVIGRSRGADWLYTYLRDFYRDPARPTGWNNLIFPSVAMPHVLVGLQGVQVLKTEEGKDSHGRKTEIHRLVLESPGSMTPVQYDQLVGDLVNYLVYMGEPARMSRVQIGIAVMLFLGVFIAVSWLLKRAYWKDVH
ncbi:MAG: cytochrome c1 [Burkholderiales bacterium]|nr:cytochrome c1 [Burkholderiales bacterium]